MTRLFVAAALAAPLFAVSAGAAEVPSFLQKGDAFCTSQRDYDDFVQNGHPARQLGHRDLPDHHQANPGGGDGAARAAPRRWCG